MPIPYYPFTGWLATHTYFMASLMTVVAIVAAYYMSYYKAKRKGLDLDMFFMSALWMGAGAYFTKQAPIGELPKALRKNIFIPQSYDY